MTSSSKNIEAFNLICLAVLSKLYESFPSYIEINAVAVMREVITDSSPYEGVWDVISTPGDVLTFLQEEGFLNCEASGGGNFTNVGLTLKGLTILGYIPSSLQATDPRESLIDKIKKALTGGAEDAGKETVKSVISEVFKLALLSGAAVARAII